VYPSQVKSSVETGEWINLCLVIQGSLGIAKNKGTSVWSLVPNFELAHLLFIYYAEAAYNNIFIG